jgi:hypothetical protein
MGETASRGYARGMPRLARLLVLLALSAIPATAEACRIRRPPIVPPRPGSDAVALGTVVAGDAHGADLRVDALLQGSAPARVHLEFGTRPGREIVIDSCGPPGPPVAAGDRVVLVFGRNQGTQTLSGWLTLDQAARFDDFFQLYPRARSSAERRRLAARWRLVNRYRGPVPSGDPEHWLPPHVGALGWIGPYDLTYVRFSVADDGRVRECAPLRGSAPDAREAAACAALARRRFAPPLFERERDGYFRVRWRDEALGLSGSNGPGPAPAPRPRSEAEEGPPG